jgi:uncharacterized protein
MLHPAVCLTTHSAVQGIGITTRTLIRKGSVVWHMDDHDTVYTVQEVLTWTAEAQEAFLTYAFQCGAHSFALCDDIDRYTNHSCDPNLWWRGDGTLTMIAHSDLHPGDELTYDYATADIVLDYRMACTCGSAACRGVITNTDYLDAAWQAQYGGHLPPHVVQAIAHARHRATPRLHPERGSYAAGENNDRTQRDSRDRYLRR